MPNTIAQGYITNFKEIFMSIVRFGPSASQTGIGMQTFQTGSNPSNVMNQPSPFDASADNEYAGQNGATEPNKGIGRREFLRVLAASPLIRAGRKKEKPAAPTKPDSSILSPDGHGDPSTGHETFARPDGYKADFSLPQAPSTTTGAKVLCGGLIVSAAVSVVGGAYWLYRRRVKTRSNAIVGPELQHLMQPNQWHDCGDSVQVRLEAPENGSLSLRVTGGEAELIRMLEKSMPPPRKRGRGLRYSREIHEMFNEIGVDETAQDEAFAYLTNAGAIARGWLVKDEEKVGDFYYSTLTRYRRPNWVARKRKLAKIRKAAHAAAQAETVGDTGSVDAGNLNDVKVEIDKHALVKTPQGYKLYVDGQHQRLYTEPWQITIIDSIKPDSAGKSLSLLSDPDVEPGRQLLENLRDAGVLAVGDKVLTSSDTIATSGVDYRITAPAAPLDMVEKKLGNDKGVVIFQVGEAQAANSDSGGQQQSPQDGTLAAMGSAAFADVPTKQLPYYVIDEPSKGAPRITKVFTESGVVEIPEKWQVTLVHCTGSGMTIKDLVEGFGMIEKDDLLAFAQFAMEQPFIELAGLTEPVRIVVPSEADAPALNRDEQSTRGLRPNGNMSPGLEALMGGSKGSGTTSFTEAQRRAAEAIAPPKAPAMPPPRRPRPPAATPPPAPPPAAPKAVETDPTVLASMKAPPPIPAPPPALAQLKAAPPPVAPLPPILPSLTATPPPPAPPEAAPVKEAEAQSGNKTEPLFYNNGNITMRFTGVDAEVLNLTMFEPFPGDIAQHITFYNSSIDRDDVQASVNHLVDDGYLQRVKVAVPQHLVEHFDIGEPKNEPTTDPLNYNNGEHQIVFKGVEAAVLRLTISEPFTGDIAQHIASYNSSIDEDDVERAVEDLERDGYLKCVVQVHQELVEHFVIEKPEAEAEVKVEAAADEEEVLNMDEIEIISEEDLEIPEAAAPAEPEITDPLEAANAALKERLEAVKQARSDFDQACADGNKATEAPKRAEAELEKARAAKTKAAAAYATAVAAGDDAAEAETRVLLDLAQERFDKKEQALKEAEAAVGPVNERFKEAKAKLETAMREADKAERAKLTATAEAEAQAAAADEADDAIPTQVIVGGSNPDEAAMTLQFTRDQIKNRLLQEASKELETVTQDLKAAEEAKNQALALVLEKGGLAVAAFNADNQEEMEQQASEAKNAFLQKQAAVNDLQERQKAAHAAYEKAKQEAAEEKAKQAAREKLARIKAAEEEAVAQIADRSDPIDPAKTLQFRREETEAVKEAREKHEAAIQAAAAGETAEVRSAREAWEAARTAVETAQAELDSAHAKVEERTADLVSANNKRLAMNELTDATEAYGLTVDVLGRREEEEEAARIAFEEAQRKAEEAAAAEEAAKSARTAAAQVNEGARTMQFQRKETAAVKEAREKLEAATQAAKAAQKAFEDVTQEVSEKTQAWFQAENAADSERAQEEAAEAKAKQVQSKTDLEEAKNAEEAARAAYEKAKQDAAKEMARAATAGTADKVDEGAKTLQLQAGPDPAPEVRSFHNAVSNAYKKLLRKGNVTVSKKIARSLKARLTDEDEDFASGKSADGMITIKLLD